MQITNKTDYLSENLAVKVAKVDYLLHYIKRNISRPDYNEWLFILSGVYNYLGNDIQAESILTSFYPDEKPNETIRKIQHKTSKHNIEFLINLARQGGFSHFPKELKQEFEYKPYIKMQPKPQFNLNDVVFDIPAKWEGNKRLFRLAVNEHIINKNCDLDGKPLPNFIKLNENFIIAALNSNILIEYIGKGYAWTPATLQESGRRISSNFNFAELVALDFDNSKTSPISIKEVLELELTKTSLFLYTTPSHTEELNRFRIVFALPGGISDPQQYRSVIKSFIAYYQQFTDGIDLQTHDPVRLFYGNNDAIFYLTNKQIIQFKKGEKI